MPNQEIYFEYVRPNADVPWAHEYIIKSADQELKHIQDQYNHLRTYSSEENGLTSQYVKTDNTNMILLKLTYIGTTPESVNHVALLHYKKILPFIKDWEQWSINYNKMWGISRVKIDPHNTLKNSILNNGEYGGYERFAIRFQTQ